MEKMNHPDILIDSNTMDIKIIREVLAGATDQYAHIVRKYNQRLYRIAMSIINDDAEAEDAMQVAYIKAYENLPKFEGRSGFATWLTRIMINESLLRVKKRKRSLAMHDELVDPEKNDIPSATQTPDMKLINSELKQVLEKAISQLPEKYRTVFIMREIEQMNVAETQECLDISEANVKVRLNRAKAMLQESLSTLYKKEDLYHFHLSRCERITGKVMKQIELL
jgi:RNA polymerase sigma-70 factor (ECF subfamily)